MTKSFPRFDYLGRRPEPATLAEPLPALLIERLGLAPELAQHTELVGHYRAAAEKATAKAAELEAVKREDGERRLAALSKGKPPPKARADVAEAELAEARSDLQALGSEVVKSASKLLQASVAHLPAARKEAEQEAEEGIAEVRRLLQATETALAEADARAAVFGWVARFAKEGVVTPWRAGAHAAALPNVRQHLALTIAGLEEDILRREERRQEAERERQQAETAKLAPGTTIWRGGETITIGEKEAEAER